MKKILKVNKISIKLGLLFSGIFVALLLILGSILYGVFTNLFVDYIKQDLVVRGTNHAKVLAEQFNQETIGHVVRMESDVTTNVLITDANQNILASSIPPDQDIRDHLLPTSKQHSGGFVEDDWKKHNYIIAVSPIGKGEGYVYMYYPSRILREIVLVLNVLMIVSGVGIVLLAFGLIGMLSNMLAKPLVTMKEATNKMALGKYKQRIPVTGEDEIALLGKSIQSLGEQLQEYEDSRNDFLASIAHELRTPLTYIKGYSDILNKGIVTNKEEQEEYLKIINKEASRISMLINDLFDMSKLQVGQFELNKEWADLNPLIEKVMTNLMPAAEKKGISIKAQLMQLPTVNIDILRIEQALYNLLENAIKYTNEGNILLRSNVKKEFIIIEIIDKGIGIPEADLHKIWDRFYRVDQSRTRKTGGSGLGLYVVKNIIKSHNGDIRVKSKENEGSTFTIFLEKE